MVVGIAVSCAEDADICAPAAELLSDLHKEELIFDGGDPAHVEHVGPAAAEFAGFGVVVVLQKFSGVHGVEQQMKVPFAVKESACQGGAGDAAGGKMADGEAHDGIVEGPVEGTLPSRAVAVVPVVGVDEPVGDARQPGQQQHHAAVEQLMGMDDIVVPLLHDPVQGPAVGGLALGLGPGDQVHLAAQGADLGQVMGLGVRGGEVDLEAAPVTAPQQMHQLIFDAAHVHSGGHDEDAELVRHGRPPFGRRCIGGPGRARPAGREWDTDAAFEAAAEDGGGHPAEGGRSPWQNPGRPGRS